MKKSGNLISLPDFFMIHAREQLQVPAPLHDGRAPDGL